jgi:spermidine synthase
MSDTPAEQDDHREFVQRARGRILINGLGLGMVLQACLERRKWQSDEYAVEHATVVEISPAVIALVAPHYQARYGDRLTIVQADALTWQPPKGERYAAVWHDIWPDICTDNLPQMHTLHRRYGRRADWQGSWARWICERGY